MPDESKGSKAKKLAAARKKLKEYQTKEKRVDANGQVTENDNYQSGTTSATLSEKSNSEHNLNGQGIESDAESPTVTKQNEASEVELDVVAPTEVLDSIVATAVAPTQNTTTAASAVVSTAVAYFNTPHTETLADSLNKSIDNGSFSTLPPSHVQQNNAIQLLIGEKAQLNAELNKYRTSCREKDLECEELRTQLMSAKQRIDDLQQRYLEQQQIMTGFQCGKEELQKKLHESEAKSVDQSAHLNELQQQLALVKTRSQELEQQYKDKCNELELSQIRINQLSDVATITKDTRVESLTQTQFMYEQQIRDLQAMVQQLTQDKEQANLQYQNYAQHLNTEISNLNEKNSELSEECAKLQEHEQQMVRHIGELEREIQRNIARRDQMKENNAAQESSSTTSAASEAEITILKEKISEFDMERHEFQLKIKSQEDRLDGYIKELQTKQQLIEQLQEHLQNLNNEQPDKTKLLATMESDKIAASRALTQNVEMKKQLDELEKRFVQLTNDKADLMNKLDSEEFANREMRNNYTIMEGKLQAIDERFKFKDEEMIRLSHENMELQRKNLILQQQVDQLKHYEMREYSERYARDSDDENDNDEADSNFERKSLIAERHEHHYHDEHDCHDHDHEGHKHDHAHDHHHNHDHDHSHDHSHNHKHQHHDHHHDHDSAEHKDHGDGHSHNHEHSHNHDHSHDHDQDLSHDNDHKHQHDNGHKHNHEHDQHNHDHCTHSHSDSEVASCQEAKEDQQNADTQSEYAFNKKSSQQPHMIPKAQATKKLQQRFTKLMSQVADLTDEKQRLEHLVLQLQGETETIGEYIALYQTQRRILKQREYEKAAQMQLLQAEREQMQEKIAMLNNLVSSLGVELPVSATVISAVTEQVTGQGDNALVQQQQQQQQHDETHQAELAINQKLNSAESKQILSKIQNIITEIKENTKEIPTVPTHTADHLNCCLGKFEVV